MLRAERRKHKTSYQLLGFVDAGINSNMTITYLLMSNESIYLCCAAYFSKFIYTSSIYYYDYHLFALYIYLLPTFHLILASFVLFLADFMGFCLVFS